MTVLWTAASLLALALAALPAVMAAVNLARLRPPPRDGVAPGTLVSILIPARNEAPNIGPAVEAALASAGTSIEVVVMDDGSTDATPAIVSEIAARDPRVRLAAAPALPEGWTGKVHACDALAGLARGTHLLFVDADVRLAPHAAAGLAAHAQRTGASLVSAVPRQVMGSPGEILTVPMVNFLLLGYLPIPLMRARPHDPSLGAGCGQLMLAERAAYAAVGGHATVRTSQHDGLKLPRMFRAKGYATDLVAGAGLASCRMYGGLAEAWAGFGKNAREGMATARGLPVWTALLVGGHILPPVLVASLLVASLLAGPGPLAWTAFWPALAALALSLGTRTAITLASHESPWTIPLHPAAVAVALAIQWSALLCIGRGRGAGWKGRLYPGT